MIYFHNFESDNHDCLNKVFQINKCFWITNRSHFLRGIFLLYLGRTFKKKQT